MDNFDKDIDDLLNLTDTESTSSSSNLEIFEPNQLFVLELHDTVRDKPTTETVAPAGRIRKKKKKKTQPETNTRSESSSSSNLSDSIPRLTDAVERDEFYDANESYHELRDPNIPDTIPNVSLVEALSEHDQDQKLIPEQTQSHTSALLLEPTTITKPAVPP